MKTTVRVLSHIGFWLVVVVWTANFANGFLCTRAIGLLVGPIDILLLPAIAVFLAAAILHAFGLVTDFMAKRPRQLVGLRLSTMTLFLIAVQFLGFDPRLAGLVAKAKWSERELIEMCHEYRSGGEAAVLNSRVARWGIGWEPHFRATPEFVEVRWGSTLPRSWGFRVCDRTRPYPTPQYCTNIDDVAAPATARVTAFIGLW